MIKINDEIIGYRGNIGKVIEIEDDVVYILMKDPEAPIFDADGECGVEMMLLSDIWDEEAEGKKKRQRAAVKRWREKNPKKVKAENRKKRNKKLRDATPLQTGHFRGDVRSGITESISGESKRNE